MPVVPVEAPSELHLTYLWIGGFQITSLIVGALGGRILTSKAFSIVKSVMKLFEHFLVLLPGRFTFEMMLAIEYFQ
jgi:hypothetical protein